VSARDRQTGQVYYGGGGASAVHKVEKRKFKKVCFHPEVPAQFAAPLAQTLAVPGVTPMDPPAWEPIMWGDPAAVLAQLARSPGTSPPTARPTQVEMIALEQPQAADAAA
jgi:hypothetical protein